MRITGTFIGEIQASYEIPDQNWGREEWAQDFDAMRRTGIEDAIVIRCGVGQDLLYPSDVLVRDAGARRPRSDLLALFFELAEEHGIRLWVGTYFSGHDWLNWSYDVDREVGLMQRSCEEIYSRYARNTKAFGGWYFSQEISTAESMNVVRCFQRLGSFCHDLSGKPTMISPGIEGVNTGGRQQLPPAYRQSAAITPDAHRDTWDAILRACSGAVDIVAFQNAHVRHDLLPAFLKINRELLDAHGIRAWTNAESFELEVATRNFPPIQFDRLLDKLEWAEALGYEKAITYEFSHFMSPNACLLSARNLHRRYCRHFGISDDVYK